MEGPTIHWFNRLKETETSFTWAIFKITLIARFGGRQVENP